ncbi:MAG: hypothetical protein M1835_004784 [Candelina submexicana]|nr:MAG: hypothetical protein M1835_004784 [Candelina submexicana]
MWLDRFSGHSTPAGSPPPQNRSLSPAPRRPSHLTPSTLSQRPGYSPRSSSLSLPYNGSTSSLSTATRVPNGSALKHSITNTPPPSDVPDPLKVLAGFIGTPPKVSKANESKPDKTGWTDRPTELWNGNDFEGQSLEELAKLDTSGDLDQQVEERRYSTRSIDEYGKEKTKFEDLHRSILACDEVLRSVETYLTSFQTDLGVVSAEIETLQSRSTSLNTKLENRKTVEKLLGPAVEDISIAPAVVKKISDGPIDEQWLKALEELEKRSQAVETKAQAQRKFKAVEDIKPLLENLINRATERIRDFLVAQIKALRSPSTNAQIIQQQAFIKHKDLYVFIARHSPKLADDLLQAYINTMRWYYLNHFTRYGKALEKLKIHIIDKNDTLGQDDAGRREGNIMPLKLGGPHHDAFNLGRRIDLVKTSNQTALTAYVAEEDKSTHYLEVPFRNFNLALIDNASSEYAFLTEFFSPHSFHQVSRKFVEIFEPTFALGQSLTKQLIDNTADCLGVLLCVRLNQHLAFELQRRKVPTVDSYINGTNMLLWPRFQVIMDMHCQSIRRAIASISGRSGGSALSLMGGDSSRQSAAPHFLTQKFGQFLQGILALSSEAGDDEPVSSSLGRLVSDFEAFLAKLGKSFGEAKKRERFLFNNYSLILTIISDTDGKLAEEQKAHFEKLTFAHRDER